MVSRLFVMKSLNLILLLTLFSLPLLGQAQSTAKPKPRVVVVGVNGMELDVIRPLLLQGKMPNLSSVIKKGATVGSSNYGSLVLYQRYQFGTFSGPAQSRVTTTGGSFGGAPDYQAVNSDNDTGLRVTSLPASLIAVNGGMMYITEVFTTHTWITPLNRFGVMVPQTLYSIAYF